jgi:hypothetical protein
MEWPASTSTKGASVHISQFDRVDEAMFGLEIESADWREEVVCFNTIDSETPGKTMSCNLANVPCISRLASGE